MTDPPGHRGSGDNDGVPYDQESTGIPRWIKVVGILVAVLVLLVVVALLAGVGGHRPRRHGLSGGGQAPPPAVAGPGVPARALAL